MRILFLTYTNTLVKYDRYVAEILREKDADDLIITADSFFLSRLRLLGQRQRVDYAVLPRLAEKHNTTGFFSPELALEIEELIFGNLVTRREYVDEMIPPGHAPAAHRGAAGGGVEDPGRHRFRDGA